MGTTLKIRVLGPLEVERPDGGVPDLPPIQRRLLAALVVADGATATVGRLAEALWGHDVPESARNSLQSHVARLREALGGAAPIRTRPVGYALDVEAVSVDARAFARAVRRARADDRIAARAASLREAIRLWRGDAYDEFSDDFAADEARHLHELHREAVRLLAESLRDLGELDEAIEMLQDLVAKDPLNEPVVLSLGHTLGLAARTPEALATLDDHRARLVDDLGLDPSPAWDELRQLLVRGLRPISGPTTPGAPSPREGAAPTEAAGTPAEPPRGGTPTLGRERERDRVRAGLAAHRLVTLVGAGGIGKTRLAALVAAEDERPAWVSLASVRDPSDLAPTVVEAMGWAPAADRDVAVTALAAHGGLVVLDNAEHLLDEVARLVDGVLHERTPTRLLATSRERLDVAGEHVVAISPLPVPEPDLATADDPAVRLFLEQLAAAGGAPVEPAEAARIVAAVDGLPLAIELAAARAATLSVPALLDGMDAGLAILGGTRRRHGDRHHTIRAVIDWSHDLLSEEERILFRRLSVFAATFTVADVVAVCSDDVLVPERTPATLAGLVERSLVLRPRAGRHRLLEPLRHDAGHRLAEVGEGDRLLTRHRDAALELARRADDAISGPEEAAMVAALEAALPDLRAVHRRAVRADDVNTVARLATGLYRFAYLQARTDLLAWTGLLVDHGSGLDGLDEDLQGRALAVAGCAHWLRGDVERATSLAARADELATSAWSRMTVAEFSGDVHVAVGDLATARSAYEEYVALAREVEHVGLAAQAQAGLALVHLYDGDPDGALALARQSVAAGAQAGSPSVQALADYTLGEVLAGTDPERALAAFEQAGQRASEVRARFHEGLVRTADVALRSRHGDPGIALARYRDAMTVWDERRADGMLTTTLRNLVVLLARVGADTDALTVHAALDRLADKPTFGDEARTLDLAVAAARNRLDGDARSDAEAAADRFVDLRAIATFASAVVTRLLDHLD